MRLRSDHLIKLSKFYERNEEQAIVKYLDMGCQCHKLFE